MPYYLVLLLAIYACFLVARNADRKARQAFAARLGALYRMRSEFWRIHAWAREARERGDADAGARFGEQAAELIPKVTGQTVALRRDHPEYAAEMGWTGLLDEELADMGRAVASPGSGDWERWSSGRGRRPASAVLNPPPTIEQDALTGRIHMAVGAVLGALTGWLAWVYSGNAAGRMSAMLLYMLIGAVVVGHVAGAAKDTFWSALGGAVRRRWWLPER